MQVAQAGAHAVHIRPSLQRNMLASEVPRSLMVAQTAYGLINVTTAVRRYPAATGAEPHLLVATSRTGTCSGRFWLAMIGCRALHGWP